MSVRRPPSENAQAARITKAGLRNSDGWIATPASEIQRRAPFTSAPKSSVATTSAMPTTIDAAAPRAAHAAARRSSRSASPRRPAAGTSTCRLTKWKVDRPSRSATGGLPAMPSTMPGHHQDHEGGEQQTVDGPPPVGEGGAFDARDHGSSPLPMRARCRAGRRTRSRKCGPAHLEVRILVVGGAGRRQQHHGLVRRAAAQRQSPQPARRFEARRSVRRAPGRPESPQRRRSPCRSGRPSCPPSW